MIFIVIATGAAGHTLVPAACGAAAAGGAGRSDGAGLAAAADAHPRKHAQIRRRRSAFRLRRFLGRGRAAAGLARRRLIAAGADCRLFDGSGLAGPSSAALGENPRND